MLVLPAITHTETIELTNGSIVRFLKVVAEKTIEVFRREQKENSNPDRANIQEGDNFSRVTEELISKSKFIQTFDQPLDVPYRGFRVNIGFPISISLSSNDRGNLLVYAAGSADIVMDHENGKAYCGYRGFTIALSESSHYTGETRIQTYDLEGTVFAPTLANLNWGNFFYRDPKNAGSASAGVMRNVLGEYFRARGFEVPTEGITACYVKENIYLVRIISGAIYLCTPMGTFKMKQNEVLEKKSLLC